MEHTLPFLGQRAFVATHVGNTGIFLACSLACFPIGSPLFACFQSNENVPIGSPPWRLVYPKNVHQLPRFHILVLTRTNTNRVAPIDKQDAE